jgi:hypothetical protein
MSVTDTDAVQVLDDAARLAQHAPSILDTQPWRWRVREEVLELLADHSRQIRSIDPEGRLLTLSCARRCTTPALRWLLPGMTWWWTASRPQ